MILRLLACLVALSLMPPVFADNRENIRGVWEFKHRDYEAAQEHFSKALAQADNENEKQAFSNNLMLAKRGVAGTLDSPIVSNVPVPRFTTSTHSQIAVPSSLQVPPPPLSPPPKPRKPKAQQNPEADPFYWARLAQTAFHDSDDLQAYQHSAKAFKLALKGKLTPKQIAYATNVFQFIYHSTPEQTDDDWGERRITLLTMFADDLIERGRKQDALKYQAEAIRLEEVNKITTPSTPPSISGSVFKSARTGRFVSTSKLEVEDDEADFYIGTKIIPAHWSIFPNDVDGYKVKFRVQISGTPRVIIYDVRSRNRKTVLWLTRGQGDDDFPPFLEQSRPRPKPDVHNQGQVTRI
ncbi:MAG: hypothetical protein EKK48_29850 [Candidatus Melainabacteria bacterium]|nr:MAG: hypothetical protein EKK48_29850 [Candidatus Melainabacteria bacterium]